jgi:hypothetical protein
MQNRRAKTDELDAKELADLFADRAAGVGVDRPTGGS